MRIIFLARSLQYGGTERQLIELAKGLCEKSHSVKVVEFYSGGALESDLQSAKVTFHSLEKGGRWDVLPFLWRLVRYLKQERPEILYAFLGIPCIISAFLKIIFLKMKIVWGVRASIVDLSKYDLLSRYAYKLECLLSHFANLIIANSNAGKLYAIDHGFPQDIEVIPNGVDVERFTPNNSTRQQLREAWNIEKDAFLIGFVGRLDPMKDLHTFLAAASLVASQSGKSTFVCVGKGLTADVPEQRATQEKYGLGNRIIWAGVRDDMPAIYNSLDLLVSSSYGEGFSNVIAEAMACGVPCVVTDVGDSALIVGETGILVPPQSPEALADGVVAMLNKPGFLDGTLKSACRMRIVENFTTERLIENTTVLFNKLLCSE